MSTTSILVEILIIGVQATAWVIVLVSAVFGTTWLDPALIQLDGWEPLITIVFLSICYTLGIVIDRFSDVALHIFDPRSVLMKQKLVKRIAMEAIEDRRMELLVREGKASEMLEHIRSRVRISRSTAFNASLFAFSCVFYWCVQGSSFPWLMIGGILFGILLTFACLVISAVLEETFHRRLMQARSVEN